jgi:hypothetical protein
MPDARPRHHHGAAVRHALSLTLWLVALGCGPGQSNPLGGGQNQRPIVDAWLLCYDCTNGEIDSVTAVGKLQPETVETLSTDLLTGPSSSRLSNIEQQLRASFTQDSAYEIEAGLTPPLSSTSYIRLYLGNYVAVYRARAGVALGKIGGARAGTVLDSAIAGQLRPPYEPLRSDVKDAVKAARDSLWSP